MWDPPEALGRRSSGPVAGRQHESQTQAQPAQDADP
jgi:hypothetical protein